MSLPLKNSIQKFLDRAGVYHRLKVSWIYDSYWKIANPQIVEDRRLEIRFYRKLLTGFRAGDLIFDIGANQGYKTDIFLRLGAKVVSVDPDDTNQEIMKRKFVKFRLRKLPLAILGVAISDKTATETFWIDEPGSAKNTLSKKWADSLKADDKRFGHKLGFGQKREVQATTMEQLIATHGLPYFIKIDVEGYELNVLRGMRQPVPYLSFEVNLPEFKAEGLECVKVLQSLEGKGLFNYTVDCRSGMALDRWLGAGEFLPVLESCDRDCIEVIWKT